MSRTVRTFEAMILNQQQVRHDLNQLRWTASKLWNETVANADASGPESIQHKILVGLGINGGRRNRLGGTASGSPI